MFSVCMIEVVMMLEVGVWADSACIVELGMSLTSRGLMLGVVVV